MPTALSRPMFRNPSTAIFKSNMPTCLNFNTNKKKAPCLILMLRNLVLKVFLTQQMVIHPPQAHRRGRTKGGENYQHTEEKVYIQS
jgi:hypothetical protein